MLGNRQHAVCHLNPRHLFCRAVTASSPLPSVSNPPYFLFFIFYESFKISPLQLSARQLSLSLLFFSTSNFLYCHFSRVSAKMHGPFTAQNGNPGKLYKLHNGNLPHIVLPCAVKQAALLSCAWKEKQKPSPNQIGNSVLPF